MTATTSPTPDRPLVSVVIPAYNCGPFLGEALDSVLAQGYDPLQIIVADDGSTDETPQVLQRYQGRVEVVSTGHRGAAAARNAALARARGPLVATLDADDAWLPGKLFAQVEVMQARPDVAVCHTASELFGTETGDGPMTEDLRRAMDGLCFPALFRRIGILTTTTMLRRSMMPPHGYHEDIYNSEDYGLLMEMLFDHPAAYIPRVLARYRRRPGQTTTQDRGQRNQIFHGLARMRALDLHRSRMPAEDYSRYRQWALEELRTCAYSRYWRGDWAFARKGFAFLRQYGGSVPFRHRLAANLRARLAGVD